MLMLLWRFNPRPRSAIDAESELRLFTSPLVVTGGVGIGVVRDLTKGPEDEGGGSGFGVGGPLPFLPPIDNSMPPALIISLIPFRGKGTGGGGRCGTLLFHPEFVETLANDQRRFCSARWNAEVDAEGTVATDTREREAEVEVTEEEVAGRFKSHRRSSTAAARSFLEFASDFTGRRLRTNCRGSFSPRLTLGPGMRPVGEDSGLCRIDAEMRGLRGVLGVLLPEEVNVKLLGPTSATRASSPAILFMRLASSSGWARRHLVKNWAKPVGVKAGTHGLMERGRGRKGL
ncbi:hypothetical protein RRF57_005078 [Xylaria bambusicola]|uniref:Uncharacterized protein n=1 Tax=Xylaria bambusicola TaxID=326684 RepID=A0AAN7Z7E3_9PEZI